MGRKFKGLSKLICAAFSAQNSAIVNYNLNRCLTITLIKATEGFRRQLT